MKKSLYFPIIFVLGLGVAVGAYLMHIWRGQQTFPDLDAGRYVGTISSEKKDGLSASFYLERKPDSELLNLIVFKDSWVPSTVELRKSKEAYQAVTLWHKGNSYTFSGYKHDEGLDGKYYSSVKDQGEWSLRKIENVESDLKVSANFNLESWLKLRIPFITLKNRFEREKGQLKQDEETFYRLQKAVSESDSLKQRTDERKQFVLNELEELNKKRLSTGDEVFHLVEQLDVMKRVTKRGRVVDLARRINERENKWYRVNWKTDAEQGASREFSLDQQEIDLDTLEVSFKDAKEKRRMLREIQSEKQRIALLNRQLNAGGVAQEQPKKKKKRSFMDKLWGRD